MTLARCPKCNKEVEVDTSVVLTSIPPMYNLDCPFCGRQYVFCKDCYTDNSAEQNISRKIETLERHVKEISSRINIIEDKLYKIENLNNRRIDEHRLKYK